MKNLFYLATAVCIMAACSNNDVDLEEITHPVNAVPIQLSQNVNGITARGVIENGSDVTATILTCNSNGAANWSDFNPKLNNTVNDASALTDWANVSTATFKAGTNAAISLTTPLYYYTDNHTYLAAVAPAGTATSTTVDLLKQDGEQDVMYASADAGTKPSGSPASATNLAFSHLTTQLKFALGKSNNKGNGDWSATIYIKEITLQNAQVPTAVTFATGNVIWSNATSLSIPGITSSVVPAYPNTVSAGRSVMVNASDRLLLNVMLSIDGEDKSYVNIPVKNQEGKANLQTVIGSSHLITLTVKEPVTPTGEAALVPTATVTPWNVGGEGSGTLE